MITLSIRQPWAWCIVQGYKPVENREWSTKYRGRILVHAGITMARHYYDEVRADLEADGLLPPGVLPGYEDLQRGGVVGATTITDCVTTHASGWFTGTFGFVCQDSRPLPFYPVKGQLGFFDVRGVELG